MCTIGLGLTKTFKGVLVCRFLMGCFEAGFVPGEHAKPFLMCLRMTRFLGCAYLIGRYYKRQDFSIRYALFFGASAFAGAFGGVSELKLSTGQR